MKAIKHDITKWKYVKMWQPNARTWGVYFTGKTPNMIGEWRQVIFESTDPGTNFRTFGAALAFAAQCEANFNKYCEYWQ